MKANQRLLRDMNQARVLELLLTQGPLSRSCLAAKLGLAGGTITAISQSLLDQDILLESGQQGEGKGRRSVLLSLNAKAARFLCLSVGASRHRLLLGGLDGQPLRLVSAPAVFRSKADFIQSLCDLTEPFFAQEQSRYGIVCLTLALDGLITDQTISFGPLSFSLDQFTRILAEECGTPIHWERHCRLAALGESVYALKSESLAYLHIGQTFGLGLLHHGAIWSGARGQGGLAEHLPFPDGTWGSEVTVPAILSYSGIQGGFSAFLSDYEKKGPAALKAAHRFFSLLSPILSSLFWLYDPALFVLYSPFTAACEPLFLALQQSLGPNKSRLYRSFFQQDAALFGALAFGVCQFLGIRTFASPHFPSPLTEERMEEQK